MRPTGFTVMYAVTEEADWRFFMCGDFPERKIDDLRLKEGVQWVKGGILKSQNAEKKKESLKGFLSLRDWRLKSQTRERLSKDITYNFFKTFITLPWHTTHTL